MNELKKELSKLTGIDFFNPKFREVFKKYFPNEKDAEEEKDEELLGDGTKEQKSEADDKTNVNELTDADVKSDEGQEPIDSQESNETNSEDLDNAAIEDVAEDKKASEDEENTQTTDLNVELLDAKIELELIKNGVSTERLNSAKKLAKYEITSLDELDKVKDLIKEYPEWVRNYNPANIGMPVDEDRDDLTEEEKRLKEMGIDPRG